MSKYEVFEPGQQVLYTGLPDGETRQATVIRQHQDPDGEHDGHLALDVEGWGHVSCIEPVLSPNRLERVMSS